MGAEKVVLIFLLSLAVSLAFSFRANDARCDGLPADQIVPLPHEYNCSLFYECFNGQSTVQMCEDDLYYNNLTQACDFQNQTDCTNGNSQCANSSLDYLPHPEDCTKYIECYEGDSYEMRCPNGYWFDSQQKMCVLPENSDCSITTTPAFTTPPALCFGLRPNETVLTPVEGDCRKYWRCTGAQLTLETCPGTLLFDEARQLCDFPETVTCDDTTRTPDPSTVTTQPTTSPVPTTPAIEDPRCVDDSLAYWPHPTECHRYIECYKGDSYDLECPSGLYYSDELKQCVDPKLSDCAQTTVTRGPTTEFPSDWTADPNCPYPEAEGKLMPYPGDCTLYYECAEGKQVAMPCPDNLWFNPTALICDYPYQAGCEYARLSFLDLIHKYFL